jgi:hypothetical protein
VQPQARVQVGSQAGLLAAVPHLLGFHPARSLVVLGVAGPHDRVSLAFRYDLPDPADAELAADIAEHAGTVLAREAIGAVALVGYGPASLVTQALDAVVGVLLRRGLEIREVLRADGGRYWSALCQDPACCPADGVSYDPCSHPVAATLASQAGKDALPDREALARTLQPEPGSARLVREATRRALRRLDRLMRVAEQAGRDPSAALAEAGRRAVRQAIARYQSGGRVTERGPLAFLAVTLADLRVRDDAWARMDPEHCAAHLRLWTDVVTGAAPEFVPAAASLLAFTAWQSGDGALANVAVDRALAADPAYSMALLIAEAVQGGLPPSFARLSMTPEEVAASYAAQPEQADQSAEAPPAKKQPAKTQPGSGPGGRPAPEPPAARAG